MSSKAFDSALDFIPENKSEKKSILAAVTEFFKSVAEGIEMAKRYQVLTERGVHPADAAHAAMALKR